MAIKDPLMFITIEEFKNWKGFNKSLFDEVTTPDSEIRYAIEIASSNIDFLSGFTISKKWPEINPTKFTDNIQTATTHYVNFLLGKGVEYARGQASIGQGGITYSQNNPEEPYYIVPQVFNYLKEINEYPTMQGFNLDVSPKQNWFKKFMGNGGEQNPWEIYVQSNNIKSSDDRTKITITHPKNIMGSVVDIDTRGIKTNIDNSLWEVDKDNINFVKLKDDKGIIANNKRIIDVGTPTFLSDATTKVYVDNLLDKKQDKLISGTNITIDENNKISATGGKTDLTDYYKKEEINKKLDDKMDKNQFKYAFSINTIASEIPNLETTDKTIAGAINELLDKKQDKLIAGENIKINKETNTISATGGSLVDENRIFNNKDDKDNTIRLVNEVIKTNVGGKTLIYRNNPVVTDDNDIPNKKYIDDKIPNLDNYYKKEEIDKKIKDLNIIKWKNVGTKESDIKINYNFKLNTLYKVGYSWNTDLKSAISYIEFLWQGKGTILDSFFQGTYGKNVVDSYVDLLLSDIYITMERFNYKEGKLHSLQEETKENIYQINSKTLDITSPRNINIEKSLKINSMTLNINELAENTFDIELKNNPIPPSPSSPKWKEVGIVGKNKWGNWAITYDFQDDKQYRVFYNWSENDYIKIIKEFIFNLPITTNEITSFQDGDTHQVLTLTFGKELTIYDIKGKWKGKLWKLQELQE